MNKENTIPLIFRLSAPLIIMLALWILSSQSTLPVPKNILGWDKLHHFIAYAILSAAAGLWFSRNSWLVHRRRNFLISTAVASVYGVVDEIHQYFVPGRASDIWDWVADTLGGATGALAIMLIMRSVRPLKEKSEYFMESSC